MSLSSLFSRLISPLTLKHNKHNSASINVKHQPPRWWQRLARFFIAVTLILSAVWLLLAVYYHFGISSAVTWLTALVVISLLTSWLLLPYLSRRFYKTNKPLLLNKGRLSKALVGSYALVWLLGLGWFLSIEAKQDRDWKPEVSQVLSYTRDANNPDLITFTNVRNFDWYPADGSEEIATERWQTRTIDMSKLSGIDIANSYWMGPLIAHTLVSFRFEDDRPLSFSFEIRKEEEETFSALAGFFRRFELSLIASEERDIIYTRTNARGEQVYLFPISHLQQSEVKALFESYLIAADELKARPAWYNTFTSNCTNIIFYMARVVSGERLPWDYRIWVSGWLPNYLYDIGMLDASAQLKVKDAQLKNASSINEQQNTGAWSMDTWYERTHINPKVIGFDNKINLEDNGNNAGFSKQIRQGLPIPPLADTQAEAEANALSQARMTEK